MQIKFLGKEYTVKMEDLEKQDVGGLKQKIKEVVPQCSSLANEKILLFYNKTKVTGGDDVPLDDKTLKMNDESVVFVVVISNETNKTGDASKKSTPQQAGGHGHQTPNNMGGMPFGMGGMGGAGNGTGNMGNGMGNMPFNNKFIEQALNNPEFFNTAMEFATQNASPEEKAMAKSLFENMKNDPETMKQLMEKVQSSMGGGMGGAPMMNPGMMGSPMMNPGMMNSQMNSPMMNNQMGGQGMNPYMMNPSAMGSQMNSPMMNPGMMNNPMMNPYYQNQMMQNPQFLQYLQSTLHAPPEGPCCHGYYPLKVVDGQKTQQNPEEVYAEKLRSLSEMGFPDRKANLEALTQAKGDLSDAIEILTKNFNK